MKREEVDLAELSISVPTVPHDLSVKELLDLFDELVIYRHFTVMKGGQPIGIVTRDTVRHLAGKDLTAGDISSLCCRVRNTSVSKESLTGLLELIPLEKHPAIITDKRGNYLGILTYDTVLHFITHHKEFVLPVVQRIHTTIGKKEFLCVFGFKNLSKFREVFGSEKQESVYRILLEDVKDLFKGDVSGIRERAEVWILTREKPKKDQIKELFREFHREYILLFGEFQKLHIYGYCIDLSQVESQEELYRVKDELQKRAKKIEGSVFIIHGLQPTLTLHDPSKQKLISNIKKKISYEFKEILEELRSSPKDMWEHVLYDAFERFPYFELFYIMGSKGLQITNNIVNPKADYFVAQGKKGSDRSDKPYFIRAMEEGLFISDVYLSRATDDFCITISQRFTHEGKTYVLAGDINFREVHRLVRSLKEPVS